MFSFSSSIIHKMTFRGLVTLKKSLNYEERSSYNLVVEAQDAGDNVLSSTASIFVQASSYSRYESADKCFSRMAPIILILGGGCPRSEAGVLERSLLGHRGRGHP